MPNGDINPVRKSVFSSATPSPSASRSRTILLGLGVTAPAFFMNRPWKKPLMPSDLPLGLGGALVSATRMSPLGRR
jgi:hypothetical protein